MKPLNTTITAIPPSGIRRFFDIAAEMDDVISLGVGEPDFVTPWRIREAGIYALEHGYTTYTSNAGLPRLRDLICADLAHRYGATYDPGTECLITTGVSEGLDLALADPTIQEVHLRGVGPDFSAGGDLHEFGTTDDPATALAWVTDRRGVTSTILGARTLEQLTVNLKAADLHLTAEEYAGLDAASDLRTTDYPYGEMGVSQRSRDLAG